VAPGLGGKPGTLKRDRDCEPTPRRNLALRLARPGAARAGGVCVPYVVPPNVQHAERIRAAAEQARRDGLGIYEPARPLLESRRGAPPAPVEPRSDVSCRRWGGRVELEVDIQSRGNYQRRALLTLRRLRWHPRSKYR
jgi:hypothetical protein